MTPHDDIPLDTPASGTEPAKPLRSVGPESESRGGSEAPGETLGEAAGQAAPAAGATSMAESPDGMPGGRAALPPGSLPKPYLGPQGDENRDPPANAPTAPGPSPTVENAARDTATPTPGRG